MLNTGRPCFLSKANSKGKEALTQAIGRAAAEAGLEALIVPSAQSRAKPNLAVFMENLRSKSIVELWE